MPPTLTFSGHFDLVLWAGACAVVGIVLWSLIIVRRASRTRKIAPQWVVVDGSNVMYWNDNTPKIDTVREVLDQLSALGFTPGIMFDANAGYLLMGQYVHDQTFEKVLELPRDHVMVVHKGVPADISILEAAREYGARVVSNDKFRDWAETYPEVQKPGFLIRGEYLAGKLCLDLGNAREQRNAR